MWDGSEGLDAFRFFFKNNKIKTKHKARTMKKTQTWSELYHMKHEAFTYVDTIHTEVSVRLVPIRDSFDSSTIKRLIGVASEVVRFPTQ